MDWDALTEHKKINMFIIGATKDYIFVKNGKYESQEPTEENKCGSRCAGVSVDVYTWDMKPVKELCLNKNISVEMLLDTKRSKIYVWPMNMDFEKIYTYDYSL